MKIFNSQNLITLLACIGIFFLSRVITKLTSRLEIKSLNEQVYDLQKKSKQDSLLIADKSKKISDYEFNIYDLNQTIDASKDNDKKFQSIITQLKTEKDSYKQKFNESEKFIKCMEESGSIRYFVKPCLSSWYIEQKEKPTKIKELK